MSNFIFRTIKKTRPSANCSIFEHQMLMHFNYSDYSNAVNISTCYYHYHEKKKIFFMLWDFQIWSVGLINISSDIFGINFP